MNNIARPASPFVLIIAVAALAVIILLRAPLGESLWLDETVAAWVAKGSPSEAIHRAISFQGQSPLYFLILHLWLPYFQSEAGARLLSILCAVVGAVGLAAIARQLGLSVSLALLAFLCIGEHTLAAITLRPYALASALVLWATYFLIRWLKDGKIQWVLLYTGALIGVFYAHYLFIACVVVHALFIGFLSNELPSRWRTHAALLLALMLTACIPGMLHLASWYEKRSTISYMKPFDFTSIVSGILPINLFLYIAMGAAVAFGFYRCRFAMAERQTAAVLIGWTVLPYLMMAGISVVTGAPLTLDRYYLWRTGGAALLSAWFIERIAPARARVALIVVWICLASIFESARTYHVEGWREAFAQSRSDLGPLLLYSGLAELEEIDWLGNPEREQYLSAPALFYGVPDSVPIPGRARSSKAEAYFNEQIAPLLATAKRVTVVALRGIRFRYGDRLVYADELWREKLERARFAVTAEEDFGQVRVISFSGT